MLSLGVAGTNKELLLICKIFLYLTVQTQGEEHEEEQDGP